MASNLSTIGFVFADEEAFRTSMVAFAAKADAHLDFDGGTYGVWRSRSGAELWFHFGPSKEGNTEIFGLTPFFEGSSEVELRITGPIHRDNDTAFEGAYYAWVNPDDEGSGSYPLVFDAVDFAAHAATTAWPAVVNAKLAGFAREVKAYAGEDDYRAATGDAAAPQLAAQAFIPIGLFAAAEVGTDAAGNAATPSSAALLTGRVAEFSRLKNEATGQDFVWVFVESLEATFDILADPEIISGELTIGGIVEASVWLFGRLTGIAANA